jgi:transglutaminase-like putative cysteine protease
MSPAVAPARAPVPPSPPVLPERGALPAPDRGDESGGESLGIRLVAFAALAAFAAGHWGSLVANPPALRVALAVATAATVAVVLSALGADPAAGRLRHVATHLIAAAAAVTGGALGFVAIGLPARLLAPGRFGELSESLDAGLAGIRTVDWPYSGPDEWVRLAILLAVPLALTVAAALAFWPARSRRARAGLRAAALVVLLALYGMPVTEHDPGAPLLRGLLLLALVAGWAWLPRLRPREAAPGAALVLAVGVCALPLAATLDGDEPWIDYTDWQWFGEGGGVEFDWTHSYGPLDWPRDGTTLLRVRADRAHYWKAETLDAFDGFRWTRSRANTSRPPQSDVPLSPDSRWFERIRFTVRSLRSDFVVGAGTTIAVRGAAPIATSGDGTTSVLDEPLSKGDSYSVFAYAPDPSAREMRVAPQRLAPGLVQYTSLLLPGPGETARRGRGFAGDAARSAAEERVPIAMALRGEPGSGTPRAERRVLGSPYGGAYRLALRLTAGAPTTYDAVKRVGDHLRRNYDYSEAPPERDFPLAAFLFRDRVGYCQQFSGAMALMLRLAGIPSRVATGFSPGVRDGRNGEFTVRDTDAHSWVEVWFEDIGWVPFDPTPSLSPAQAQSGGLGATSADRGDAGAASADAGEDPGAPRALDAAPGASRGGNGAALRPWTIPLALVALAGLGALVALARRRFVNRRACPDGDSPELRELRDAIERLGFVTRPGTTLLALERRLEEAGAKQAARYVHRLRAQRFGAGGSRRPDPAGRRALRRELASGAGRLGRLRALVVLPPRPLSGR